ncbi:hypothetical protein Leryth_005071 [Lithospermum erythrorhizon]|nr:hypothetical protein Leryth_005071 [Lithospermum erythrorhizon]
MNQAIQNYPSSAVLGLPSKRRRGRPKKDHSANRLAITRVPPGFGRPKEKLPQCGHPTNVPNDRIVGQTVTAVVDAAFDAGYLLSVRIGNSIFRGVVFKPGHIAPVTVENDVAPHVQAIRRNDIHVPANNGLGNSTVQNGSPSINQWLGREHRTTGTTTTTKGKYASPSAPSVFPVGARGTLVPVVLQPASMSNDFTPTPQLTPSSSGDLGVDGVYTVEPLAMFPSVSSYRTPVGQNQALPSQTHVNQQGAQAGALNGNVTSVGATMTNEEEVKQLQSPLSLVQDDPAKEPQDSPPPSEIHDCNLNESNMSHGHASQHVHPSLPEQSITVSQPLGRYPTGRMTDLLLALQENMMENQAIHAEPPSSTSTADHDEESGD